MIVYLDQLMSRDLQILLTLLDQQGAPPVLTPTFFTVRLAVASSQQRRIQVSVPSWLTAYCHVLMYVAPHVGHYIHRRNALSSDTDCIFAIVCVLESEFARSRHSRGPWVRDLGFPVVSTDDRLRASLSLSQAKVFLLRNGYRLVKRLQFQA